MSDFSDILKAIDQAVYSFDKRMPAIQKQMYTDVLTELKRLDLKDDNIKTTVANLKVIQSVKNKLTRLILSDSYLKQVKEFAQAFNDVTKLQNLYWQSIEQTFSPSPLLNEIKNQAIDDTVNSLTEAGIGNAISEEIAAILRTNITTGGSYWALTEQLRESLVQTDTDGLLQKYTRQITTDALNQYSAQYTQRVSSDLGFEWYAYQGSEIMTSRPFCQAMVENNRYFHISQVPNLLEGRDANGAKLIYNDNYTGKEKTVEIYSKTGLPSGFIPGTNEDNFFVNRGGYLCGHQARPVSEASVPLNVRDTVYATPAYKAWKGDA